MNLYYILLEVAGEHAPKSIEPKQLLTIAIVSVVIALIVAFIRNMSLKGQLTSVHKNDTAADYTRDKSFKVETSKDLFLYSKVDKKEKPNSNANSSSGK